MFTIDGSGSMSGTKWQHVSRGINRFIENMSEDDMISTIIFNDKPKCVTEPLIFIQMKFVSIYQRMANFT